jgi:hypothetical protein
MQPYAAYETDRANPRRRTPIKLEAVRHPKRLFIHPKHFKQMHDICSFPTKQSKPLLNSTDGPADADQDGSSA